MHRNDVQPVGIFLYCDNDLLWWTVAHYALGVDFEYYSYSYS
jgi:hypothetical protein